MRFLALLSLAAVAAAFPRGMVEEKTLQGRETDIKPWVVPGLTDSRSPCPMLNTMANHGYFPHNGRNLTIRNIADGLHAGIHFSHADATGIAQTAFAFLADPATIDLADLNAPGSDEHIASLTRRDRADGDSLHLDPARLAALLADSPTDALTVPSLARSRRRVEAGSAPARLDAAARERALGEAGLVLQVMSAAPLPAGDDDTAAYAAVTAPKTRVAAWLGQERLPVELGWRRPAEAFRAATAVAIGAAVKAAQEELEGEKDGVVRA